MELLRLVIIGAVLWLLAVRARWAWRQRALAVRVWRAIRPRHVAGAVGLLVAVMSLAIGLFLLVPVSRIGVGTIVGLDGNAIFAPIDSALEAPIEQAEQAAVSGRPPPGVPWGDVAAVTAFLGLLTALFPVLAHAEERAFRTGWESYDLGRQVLSALRFGMIHLVMLIPLAAALAISVAGFAYGRIYRRAYASVPVRMVVPRWQRPTIVDEQGFTRLVAGPPSPEWAVDRVEARNHAVFTATVWHTTFNTVIAVVVWLGYLAAL